MRQVLATGIQDEPGEDLSYALAVHVHGYGAPLVAAVWCYLVVCRPPPRAGGGARARRASADPCFDLSADLCAGPSADPPADPFFEPSAAGSQCGAAQWSEQDRTEADSPVV